MSACPDTLKSGESSIRDLRKFTRRGITELLAGDSTFDSWKAKDGGFEKIVDLQGSAFVKTSAVNGGSLLSWYAYQWQAGEVFELIS